jgi:prevent-host-death family protein
VGRYTLVGGRRYMSKTITVTDLEKSLRTVLDSVVKEHVQYVLTSDSQPEAALVPYDEFLRLQQLKEKGVLERFDKAQELMARLNANFSDEEVARDVAEARKELSR